MAKKSSQAAPAKPSKTLPSSNDPKADRLSDRAALIDAIAVVISSLRRRSITVEGISTGTPARLQREFTVGQPNRVWVTDITYIRTWQGWLYLAAVMDLHSRAVVGWSMKPTLARELVLDALLMAWRRRPMQQVIVHSDQGSQFGSDDWLRFCRANNLEPSMSRRGNCWDTQSTI